MRAINWLNLLIFVLIYLATTLSSNAQTPRLVLPIGHTEYIKTLKISPDEKRVVTVGIDKKTILWDIETGFRLTDLDNNNRPIDDVIFNDVNTRILAIQKYEVEKSIPLWNAVNGNLIARLSHTDQIYAQEFSPDGSVIITAGMDSFVKIWDTKTGKIIDSIANGDIIFKAKFSPDGKKIITGGGGSVKVYDYQTRKLLFELIGHKGIIGDISFSPDNSKILTGSYDHSANVWDAQNGKLLYNLSLNDQVVKAYFNVNGTAIITEENGFSNKSLKLWNALTGKLIRALVDMKEEPRFAIFSHDGSLVATGSEQTDVKVWDTKNGNLLYTLKEHYGGARTAKFTNNDSILIVATSTPAVKIWNMKTGQLIESLKMPTYGSVDIALNKSNTKLITPSGNIAIVWDLEKRTKLVELKGEGIGAVEKISFTNDKKLMVTDNRTGNFTRLWDISNGDMLGGSMYAQNNIERIIYSDSYQKAMVKYKDYKTIEIWDTQKGNLLSTLNKNNSSYQSRWTFSTDETKLITSSSSTELITIWDVFTGNIIRTITNQSKISTNHLLVTPDSKKIISIDNESNATIWDIETGAELNKIANVNEKFFTRLWFIGDKNWLLTSSNKESKIWDIDNGKLLFELKGLNKTIYQHFLSPDQKRLITLSYDDASVRIWDIDGGKLIAELKGKKTVGTIQISPDWKYIVTPSFFERSLRLWDCANGQLITEFNPHEINPNGIVFSKDSKFMFSYGGDKTIRKWEMPSGKLIQSYDGLKLIKTLAYNDEKNEVLASSFTGEIKLWDAETGKVIQSFIGHTGSINVAMFGLKDNTIISASDDQTIKIWNKTTGKVKNTFFPVGQADFLNQVDLGYYKSSPDASKLLHYVTKDLKPITFDQLDLKYNRPDKVLRGMGSTDTALVSAYYKAYLKRIKKLGIDTSAFTNDFNLPTVDFVNRQQIVFDQKENQVTLHIKGNDSTLLLDRFNIWVNENPILGTKGINLRARKTKNIDTTITIKLSDGNNKIETSIINVNGNESYRTPLYVNYKPEKPSAQKFYFIGIGINDFEQKQNNLTWSVKDIRDLAAAFKLKYGTDAIINVLLDHDVTLQNVIALKEKLKDCSVNDKVIIAYSGHGLLSKNFDYFLSTYNVDFEKPEKNGLPYDIFENLIADIPARKKLMLIDACHSGEVDKDELLKINNASQNLEVTQTQGGKGVKVINTDPKKAGMKTSLELMQQLFANVGRSTGSTIISAAAGTQFALEKNDLQNGVFSYSILEYMKANPHATVTDLKKYVNKRVVELTAGLQVPTTRNETNTTNWEVW